MASGPNSGLREISLKSSDQKQKNYPQRYAYNGLESVIAACNQVSANNTAILYGLKNGWLDLGACSSIPLRSMINSRELMVDAMRTLSEEILPKIEVNAELCRHMAESSASNSTMISTVLGYEAGTKVAKLAIEKNISCKEAAKQLQVLPDSVLDELFDVVNLTDPDSMEALFEKYKSYRSV